MAEQQKLRKSHKFGLPLSKLRAPKKNEETLEVLLYLTKFVIFYSLF